jgi:transcriptional regulator with XRE-family HTH domain
MSKNPPRNFGRKLNYLRLQNGLTLQELARQLGHSAHGYISELESGKKVPTVEFVLKVSDLFGVPTDQLIRDELSIGDSHSSKPSSRNNY